MQTYDPHPEAVELAKLLPAKEDAKNKKQQAKFYRLAIWPDLFGGVSLVREYGYMGLEGQFSVEAFPELDAACQTFASIVQTQQDKGYVPCEQLVQELRRGGAHQTHPRAKKKAPGHG